jgi:spermidine synthase
VDDLDEERWKSLHLSTKYYTTKLHKGSFYLPAYLEKMLMEVES